MTPPAPLPDGPLPVAVDPRREVLRVTEARDLVALVPYRLGYRPQNSLVVLCLRGPRPRVGLVMRVDLPGEEDLPVVVADLCRHARRDAATAAVAVVYRDAGLPPSTVPVLGEVLARHGVALREVWQVGADRYRSLTCRDPVCCDVDGWPVGDLDGALVSAEMVARGHAVAGSRADLAGNLAAVDGARLARVSGLAQAHAAQRPQRRAALRAWRRTALATWRSAVAPAESDGGPPGGGVLPRGEVDEAAAALLLGALADARVRDAVLLDCVPGGSEAADRLLSHGADATTQQALDAVFTSCAAVRPDEALLRRADEVLRSLVRQSGPGTRAAPLGLLAWSAWWAGDGGRSAVVVDLAVAADPRHRLAVLIAAALEGGLAPGWVQRQTQARG